jgi:hypothetical protein
MVFYLPQPQTATALRAARGNRFIRLVRREDLDDEDRRLILSATAASEDLPSGLPWFGEWLRIEVVRQDGETTGTIDRYFYSPAGHFIRSLRKADIYNTALFATHGDADRAFDAIGRRG